MAGESSSVTDRRVRISPFVISAEFEDSVVIVNLNSKRYYMLNDTAAFIWREITADKSESEIIEKMSVEYDATRDQIAASVRRLFEGFTRAELVTYVDAV